MELNENELKALAAFFVLGGEAMRKKMTEEQRLLARRIIEAVYQSGILQ